jgi:hypothetical protein
MTDSQAENPTPETSKPDESLAQALADLGKNLVGVLRVSWERPERRKLQEDIEKGVSDLGNTLRDGMKAASDNPVSQRIRADIEDLGDRMRSGQVETKVRGELIAALQTLNLELEKVKTVLAASPDSSDQPAPQAETAVASAPDESNPAPEESQQPTPPTESEDSRDEAQPEP